MRHSAPRSARQSPAFPPDRSRRAYLDGGNTGHLHPAGAAPIPKERREGARRKMPEQGNAYSQAGNLAIDDAGYAVAHRLANFIYYIASGVDVELMRMALVLRNSMGEADIVALELPDDDIGRAAKAALSIRPKPDGETVMFHETEARKWFCAIANASKSEQWPRFDPHSLAPISRDDDCTFVVEVARVIDWLKQSAHPALADAVARGIASHCGKPDPLHSPSSASVHTFKTPEERQDWFFARSEELGGTSKPGVTAKVAKEGKVGPATAKDLIAKGKRRAQAKRAQQFTLGDQASALGGQKTARRA